ncbi:Lpg1974 family pore-forming outer membrane protein [Legionella sp. W05-934-2]|uniref:Lpg1974 family pore-forming outer membrane protein n=1 Tax=Legionella sp. W05-934-2 TaxID=1198649 RepID=UPI00346327D2
MFKLRFRMKVGQFIGFVLLTIMSAMGSASGQVTLFEDLLYWHTSQQSSSPWAYQQTNNRPPGAVYTEPNAYFRWSPGGRIGILYTPQSFFDTKLYWTYFSTKALESITAPPGQFFVPEFFNGFTTANLYNSAQLDWRLIMNMFDAEVGHAFQPIDTLTVRPFIGVKGGTINQSIHSDWQATLLNIQLYSAKENLKNNFWGIGPSVGIDTIFSLFKNVTLQSDFSTALLWGHWDVQDVYKGPGPLLSFIPQTTIRTNTKNAMLGSFMARYFLGLAYTYQAKATVIIKAGYEMQFWSNQLRLPMFQALPVHGDLTLQGGTCGILIKL